MAREVLGEGASGPDVLGIDVIWPGTLSQDLIDLKPYFATELSSVSPDVVASYTVKGKLVAMPFHADIGVLFYRRSSSRVWVRCTTQDMGPGKWPPASSGRACQRTKNF